MNKRRAFTLPSITHVAALLLLASGASGEPPCATNALVPVEAAPTSTTTDPCLATSGIGTTGSPPRLAWLASSPYQSACYQAILGYGNVYPGYFQSQMPDPPDVPIGFRGNISLGYPLMPGDFLPPSPTLGGSSVPLLPPLAQSAPTGWKGLVRPSIEDVADVITGMPFVQVTDLELPFDGATFRLKRTRGANPLWQSSGNSHDKWDPHGSDKWWDWTGVGWMMSENPVLLIDSKLPDAVSDGPDTCWLILDAHHSIPFQFIESNGTYEAPPRFRARLTPLNGVRQGARWNPPATEYRVSLYDGALTYTFVAIRDELPPKGWNSNYAEDPEAAVAWETTVPGTSPAEPYTYHDRPSIPNDYIAEPGEQGGADDPTRYNHDPFDPFINKGLGFPHYAICTQIQDQYGHRVDIEYANTARRSMNDSSTECWECQQNCLTKGQIRTIRLRSGPNFENVEWTLLYVHRLFANVAFDDGNGVSLETLIGSVPESTDPFRYALHGHLAVERIYVYRGDVPAEAIAYSSLIVPFTVASGFDPSDSQWDPLAYLFPTVPSALGNWLYQVRYQYNLFAPLSSPPPEPWRCGWAPLPPWGSAGGDHLQYVTAYNYHGFVLTDTVHPSGKRFALRWVQHDTDPDRSDDDWVEVFEFNDLRYHNTVGGTMFYTTNQPGTRHVIGGRNPFSTPREEEQGYFPQPVPLQYPLLTSDDSPITFERQKSVKFAEDANGRWRRADLLEWVPHARDRHAPSRPYDR